MACRIPEALRGGFRALQCLTRWTFRSPVGFVEAWSSIGQDVIANDTAQAVADHDDPVVGVFGVKATVQTFE